MSSGGKTQSIGHRITLIHSKHRTQKTQSIGHRITLYSTPLTLPTGTVYVA